MKKSLFLTIPLLLTSCNIEDLPAQGDLCPPELGSGTLQYIENAETCNADHPESCIIDGNTYDFASHFTRNTCPALFAKCQTETSPETGETIYYCTQTNLQCSEGATNCKLPDTEATCIDPSLDKTCGAECKPGKVNGQSCKDINPSSSCTLQNGIYACRCSDNSLACEIGCIDPSQTETCGAYDCFLENYGGDNCNNYSDNRVCMPDENGVFSCQCQAGMILCDGKCISPAHDTNHCGAKGACNTTDSNSPDFAGTNCEAGEGICVNGSCSCIYGHWCIREDDETQQPRCVNPAAADTCNAKLDPDTGICSFDTCETNQSCQLKSANEFYCQTKSCTDDTEQLCTIDGVSHCLSKFSTESCGACELDCSLHNYANVEVSGCEVNAANENKIQCTYQCTEGLTNCGSPFAPLCVNTQENKQYCGTCHNACESDQTCQNGTCIDTGCPENTCAMADGNGGKKCENSNEQCGSACTPCKNLHTNAYCAAGTCVIASCLADEHPEYNANGHIIKCQKNTVNACAPSDNKVHDPIHDCIAEKDPNAESVSCNNGSCIITACKQGFHLSSDQKSCVENSNTACAPTTSSHTQNCTSINNAAQTTCQNGICQVTTCSSGYHLNANRTGCEPTSNTACAPTNSANAVNCTQTLGNAAETKCEAGTCKVVKCATGYHPNSTFTGCDQTSNTSCASPTSSNAQNCTNIGNAATTSCNNGTCKVDKCITGYHPNSAFTGCNPNSNTSCASTTSSNAQNCTQTLGNAAETKCEAGTCKVIKCATGYHPNSAFTGCNPNTNTSCASTTSANAQNCASGVAPYCVNGSCECSTDGSMVLNYDETTCVHKRCQDVYGVTESIASSSRCIASGCSEGFINNHDTGWGVCLLISNSSSVCESKIPGWRKGSISGSKCQASSCESGYTLHHYACVPASALN